MDAILTAIKTHAIQFIDLRFTDMLGKEHHVSIPSHAADADFFEYGKMFDGSSLTGFRHINESDMVLMPDVEHFHVDPFMTPPTLVLRCAVYEPKHFKPYLRDPRSLALRAEAYLRQTGIADTVYVGPEPEFFVFDSVTWRNDMHCTQYEIDSKEAAWTSNKQFAEGNMGHRPLVKGGYFPVPPVDSSQTLRSTMCQILEKIGVVVEAHHHEVATANQNEISTRFNTLTQKADELQMLKYVVHNTAHDFGKTATFMPKPLVGDNGSGMHCHQSLFKNGQNLFAGEAYAGLSQLARYYIGGIIHHAKALNAFTNASTNSYRRLVPGFEAPVMLAYSACNRSAAIRIPFTPNPKARRIEVRFPDPAINPYFAFSAMLMAGLDGIERQLDPGPALDKDLYELSEAEAKDIPKVAFSLGEALNALEQDRAFLLKGDVFSDDLIEAYIRVKREEERRVREGVHPLEFALYYSL